MYKAVRLTGNILFGLNILLLFMLVLGSRMQFPAWVQSIGRMHPLLLHLPIGGVVIVGLMFIFKNNFKPKQFSKLMFGLLTITSVTAALTAIMGLILSGEGGYNEDVLASHKITGSLLSFILAGIYWLFTSESQKENVLKIATASAFMLLLFAGHYGSILTHGDDFVFEPMFAQKTSARKVSDSTSMFMAAIQPVLDLKCTGCHNDKKKKGGLVLSTLEGIKAGGEHGDIWVAGAPNASLFMKRVLLPEDHKDHMPPKGKAQLTAMETQLLYQWILSGADTAKAWTKYAPTDSVRRLAAQLIRSENNNEVHAVYTFDAATPETIARLNDPYRTVSAVALNEPALAAVFFIRSEYKSQKLSDLKSIKQQLVSLNLSKMPVTDDDCSTIAQFDQLEKLNLNFSSITEKGLKTLSSLPNLTSLSIAGTTIDEKALNVLKDFKKLKEIYIWNTPAAAGDTKQLAAAYPKISFNMGYVADGNTRLRLTPPIPATDKTMLDAGEKLLLTHKLPGTKIIYTTDGTDPDSVDGKAFEALIDISGYTIVKTRACKDGWLCSTVGTYTLYTKGVAPIESKLLSTPNKDYRGEGISTLTNNRKGFIDDHRDIAWVGFKENAMSAEFKFQPNTIVKNITISYDRNIYGWLFPPAKVEIWGGADAQHLALIKTLKPEQPTKMEPTRNDALVIPLEGGSFEVYKIVALPLSELPKWHPGNNPKTKDKRAWLFVDEVIFNN